MLAARVALVAAATLLCAWLSVSWFQNHERTRATELLNTKGQLSAVQVDRVNELLDRAAFLNLDKPGIAFARGQAQVRAGNVRAGESILQGVVRDEPENVNAWLALQVAAFRLHDQATFVAARAHVRALAPRVPPAP